MIGNIEMSVAAGTNQGAVRVERACRPVLVTGTPSAAGNWRVGDAICERRPDAVLDWNNAITKPEPARSETVIHEQGRAAPRCLQISARSFWCCKAAVLWEPTRSASIRRCTMQASSRTG